MSANKRVVNRPGGNTAADHELKKLVLCGGLMASSGDCPKDISDLWFTLLEKARAAGVFG